MLVLERVWSIEKIKVSTIPSKVGKNVFAFKYLTFFHNPNINNKVSSNYTDPSVQARPKDWGFHHASGLEAAYENGISTWYNRAPVLYKTLLLTFPYWLRYFLYIGKALDNTQDTLKIWVSLRKKNLFAQRIIGSSKIDTLAWNREKKVIEGGNRYK